MLLGHKLVVFTTSFYSGFILFYQYNDMIERVKLKTYVCVGRLGVSVERIDLSWVVRQHLISHVVS